MTTLADHKANGRKDFADGSYYEGDLVQGVINGHGVLRWSNGDVYEGDFKDEQIRFVLSSDLF